MIRCLIRCSKRYVNDMNSCQALYAIFARSPGLGAMVAWPRNSCPIVYYHGPSGYRGQAISDANVMRTDVNERIDKYLGRAY